MFTSLLIANRGEIACRVMRTARALDLRTIAVYSDADAGAAHVAEADEAVRLGPAPAAESYLSIEAVLAAARASGAEAVHPGYGFLAENADFAEACADSGLVFVGPPAAAIRAMGDKSRAKAIMAEAGVPLVPGYHGEDQDPARLAAAAEEIGWPVLIKAAAGGGGKGMRAVEGPEGFAAALAAAQREARAAFGDDRVLVEKLLERPRHVELQVFADEHGEVVHLFERDCSIQRRHQKVLEEAPAPGLDPAMRTAMGEAAVAAARAIGYRGAGTVEFVVEGSGGGDAFHFIEMNTRLQVEHPVTELVTGQDLVEWQLRVAAGEPLPRTQHELALDGHAIEARLYAEDPAKDFLPAAGRLGHLRFPAESRHLRVDSGVRAGDLVATHYDPMLAKLIVWDHDRPAALARLARALADTELLGVTTNLAFLAAVVADEDYRAGRLDTGFIARRGLVEAAAAAASARDTEAAPDEVLAFAALAGIERRRAEAACHAAASAEPWSPWHRVDGWRLNGGTFSRLPLRDGSGERAIALHYEPDGYRIEIDGRSLTLRGADCQGDAAAEGQGFGIACALGGRHRRAVALREGETLSLLLDGAVWRLGLHDPLRPGPADEAAASGALTAPMPGKVLQVLVDAGAAVARGDPLVVLEAMKMEHTVAAPADGVVEAVHFAAGDLVEEGAELIGFLSEDRPPAEAGERAPAEPPLEPPVEPLAEAEG